MKKHKVLSLLALSLSVAFFLALVFPRPADGKAAFAFEKVADTTTVIPGHKGWVPYFKRLGGAAVDGKYVAFYGEGRTGDKGIYLYDGSSLEVVADTGTKIPGTAYKFARFGLPSSLDGNNVAFVGFAPVLKPIPFHGVYKSVGGKLQMVADTNTQIPGRSVKFNWFPYLFSASMDSGFVGFVGSNATFKGTTLVKINEMGVYTDMWGSLGVVADTGTQIPNSSSKFDFFHGPFVDGTQVAFFGGSLSQKEGGIYASAVGLNRVVDFNTNIPSKKVKFGAIGESLSFFGCCVAFIGCGSSCESYGAIFTVNRAGGSPTKVVDTNTQIPDGSGNFTGFGQVSLSGGSVAFSGDSSAGRGIYLYDFSDNSLKKVIQKGDKLDGKTVDRAGIGPEGLSGGTVAFGVDFTDGSRAVYLAYEGGQILAAKAKVPGGPTKEAPSPPPGKGEHAALEPGGVRLRECDLYAKNAVLQNRLNIARGCDFKGPGWGSDYNAHFNWCVFGENVRYREREFKAREELLLQCQGKLEREVKPGIGEAVRPGPPAKPGAGEAELAEKLGDMLEMFRRGARPGFREPAAPGPEVASRTECDRYARSAVSQNKANLARGCGLRGPGWSSDYNAHFQWCMFGENVRYWEREFNAREKQLRQCKRPWGTVVKPGLKEVEVPKPVEATRVECGRYAKSAVSQNEANITRGCGFRGSRWSSDYRGHFNWCMHGENVRFTDGENKVREEALRQCGRVK